MNVFQILDGRFPNGYELSVVRHNGAEGVTGFSVRIETDLGAFEGPGETFEDAVDAALKLGVQKA